MSTLHAIERAMRQGEYPLLVGSSGHVGERPVELERQSTNCFAVQAHRNRVKDLFNGHRHQNAASTSWASRQIGCAMP